jgi:glycosyltransferase involved in cell wall biosynthesis
MGKKGRALVVEEFSWKRIADLMLSTYEDVLANSSRPGGKRRLHPI